MNAGHSLWASIGFDLGAASELAWLLTIPLAALLSILGFKRRQRRLATVQGSMGRGGILIVRSRAFLKSFLILSALISIVIAMARPRWGFDWVDVRRKGVDIVIAVDVSQSMLAADVSPSRLARAKRAVSDFLDILKGDRVGLVAFAGSSYVQCPLTEDYGAIRMFMDYLDPSLIPVQGTDLGGAVATSLKALADGGEAAKDAKAIVIMTDGEDLEAGVEKAVSKAKEEGVRLYAVGIGTPEGGPIPLAGGGFKKDAQGQVILTKPDEGALAKMALDTGGMYVRSVPGGEDLKKIYEEGIAIHLERREFETSRERLWHERFQWFLAAALVFLVLEWMIAEVLPAKALLVLGFLIFCAVKPDVGYSADPKSAHEAFADGRYGTAAKEFLDAEIDDPDDPGHAYNRAVSQYREGRFAEAAEGFTKAAAKSQDQKFVERSMFNLGNSRVGEGKLDEAISAYEAALEIDPQDQAARENLEYVKKLKDQKNNQNQQNNDQNQQNNNNQNQDNKNDNQKSNDQNQQNNNNQNQQNNNNQNQDNKNDNQKNNDQNQQNNNNQNQDNKKGNQKNNDQKDKGGQNDDSKKDQNDSNQGGGQGRGNDSDKDQKKGEDQSQGNPQDQDSDKKKDRDKDGKSPPPRQGKSPSAGDKPSDKDAERLLRAVEDQAGKYLYVPQGSGEPPRPAKDW